MYNRTIVNTKEGLNTLIEELRFNRSWVSFDTETTGLHLKADKPFILTLSFDEQSYAIDLLKVEVEDVQKLFNNLKSAEYLIGHNVKYDLHMMENYGVKYSGDNLTDTMIIARLSLETDAVMSLALKQLAKKYLSVDSAEDQAQVKARLTSLKREKTAKLKVLLKEYGKTKKWFDKTCKNTIFETRDLLDFEEPYLEFEKENPDPNFYDIYLKAPKTMLSYAMKDTEITLDLAKKMYPVLVAREQKLLFLSENKIIMPLYRMERVGLKIDRDYLEKSRIKLKKYIQQKRDLVYQLAGEEVSVGQHKRIKELFAENWDVQLTSTDKDALSTVSHPQAEIFANTISELKSLEKWYATYILKLQRMSEFDGRGYTQINQASTVTGRVSSDFQQFPKNALKYSNGEEIFHPRKAILVTGGDFEETYYLDYSQIELRVQANYTYEISGGDLNMCRAYMPHECLNERLGDFDPSKHKEFMFTEKWLTKEDTSVEWHPVDLHSATTMQAFPDVDPTSEEFKKLRGLGKATNFAKNYGATTNALITQFKFEPEVAEALNQGYYDAFPMILDYQNLVRRIYRVKGFVKNMYGRRYYLTNKRFVYKLYNYIVQGTSADLLKDKIYEVDNYLKNYKSRFQMNIHDELSFEIYKGEEHIVKDLKKIMEDVPWMVIPVVADLEVTRTNWAEKEELK